MTDKGTEWQANKSLSLELFVKSTYPVESSDREHLKLSAQSLAR